MAVLLVDYLKVEPCCSDTDQPMPNVHELLRLAKDCYAQARIILDPDAKRNFVNLGDQYMNPFSNQAQRRAPRGRDSGRRLVPSVPRAPTACSALIEGAQQLPVRTIMELVSPKKRAVTIMCIQEPRPVS
jgi:hypothetical protein